jgi:hypothetical protein
MAGVLQLQMEIRTYSTGSCETYVVYAISEVDALAPRACVGLPTALPPFHTKDIAASPS